jgi:hypothetical protein
MAGRVMIDVQTDRGLAILELSNPDRQNAISAGMWDSIEKFARAAVDRQDIRVILVRGSGGIFSAGADISDFDAARSNASEARAYDDLIEMTCRQLEAVPQPTIALINGICFGGGPRSRRAATCASPPRMPSSRCRRPNSGSAMTSEAFNVLFASLEPGPQRFCSIQQTGCPPIVRTLLAPCTFSRRWRIRRGWPSSLLTESHPTHR